MTPDQDPTPAGPDRELPARAPHPDLLAHLEVTTDEARVLFPTLFREGA